MFERLVQLVRRAGTPTLHPVVLANKFRPLYHRSFSIPVAARFQVWVCGRSLGGIVGSNAGGPWKFVCCECCVLPGTVFCAGLITRPGIPTERGVSVV